MAQVVDFVPEDLRIVEHSTSGDGVYQWTEIVSEWLDWVRADPVTRGGFPPAFQVVGGEPRGDDQRVGATVFVMNRWKFRPAEYSHNVRIFGSVATDPDLPQESVWVPTLGAYTVGIELEKSSITSIVTVGSGVLPADIISIGNEVEGRILSDGIAFAGANLDAPISTSGGLTPEQVATLDAIETRMNDLTTEIEQLQVLIQALRPLGLTTSFFRE